MNARYATITAILLLTVAGSAIAAPVGTVFTYQGKLTDSAGVPVNGTADFRFSLWDAAASGTQIGSILSVNSVTVSGGVFTVSLDFGESPLTVEARWLEVAVRTPAGSGSYTLFGTRQQLLAVPYALHSLNADTVDGIHASKDPEPNTLLALDSSGQFPLSVLPNTGISADFLNGQPGSFYQNASNLNAGTLADARLSPNVALLNNTQTFTGAKTFSNASNIFTGSGSGLNNLNAGRVTTGTLDDARLSTNVALLNSTQTFTGAKTFSNTSNSFTGSGAGLTDLNAASLTGSIADERLSANVALLGNAQTFTGAKTFSNASNSFTGSGAGLTDLNAANLTGSIADARLSPNIALLDTAQTFSANKYFTGNVAIGTEWTNCPLHVVNPQDVHYATAIYGKATATGNVGQAIIAVRGDVASSQTGNPGAGVLGFASSVAGNSAGVRGETASTNLGTGVFAWATGTTGYSTALKARADSPNGWAGYFTGRSYFSDKVGVGTASPVYMLHVAGINAGGPVIYGLNSAIELSDSPAIEGIHNTVPGWGVGVRGVGGYEGVYGIVDVTSANTSVMGVRGFARSGGNAYGVYGHANGTGTNYGVYGYASGGATNYAGHFGGNVNVTGTLTAGSKSFKIDHPLDPENKTLAHACVEAPEMLNVYSGNVVTDGSGFATVQLPDYFDALNTDFRYQLTVIGQFAQAIVAEEIADNTFTIQTDKPSVKVSWQVTGVRNDNWAQQHPLAVEEDKVAGETGKYIHPEAFGKPLETGVGYMPPEGPHGRK